MTLDEKLAQALQPLAAQGGLGSMVAQAIRSAISIMVSHDPNLEAPADTTQAEPVEGADPEPVGDVGSGIDSSSGRVSGPDVEPVAAVADPLADAPA